jgi:hypothetical protein
MQIDFKWLAIMAFVIMGSVFAFGATSVSGAMDPVKQSQARLQDAQTADFQREVDAKRQRDSVDLETYKAQQQAQLDAQKQQFAVQTEFAKQQYAKQLAQMDEQAEFDRIRHVQELAQAEQQSRILNLLITAGGAVLILVLSAALMLLATSLAYKQIKLVGKRNPDSEFQIAQGRWNDRLQRQIEEASKLQKEPQAQVISAQAESMMPQTRRSRSDGDGREPMGETNQRLTLIK